MAPKTAQETPKAASKQPKRPLRRRKKAPRGPPEPEEAHAVDFPFVVQACDRPRWLKGLRD
eukprot:5080511-Pyramimonas_sp.AAC.1